MVLKWIVVMKYMNLTITDWWNYNNRAFNYYCGWPIRVYWWFSIRLLILFQCFFYYFFQCMKCINFSSKHTKKLMYKVLHPSSHPSFSVKTWKSNSVSILQNILFPQKVLVPLGIPSNPSCFYVFFHSLWIFLLPDKLCIFLFLIPWLSILQEFPPLIGQRSLPVSLAMLSMATLDGFLSNLGAFWRSKVHASSRKKRKSSFPPCFCTICENPMHIA